MVQRSVIEMQFLAELGDRSAKGIATAINREIRSGRLQPGERLPTVRQLASLLGTSPTTVSEAWQLLGRFGTIDARGRHGSFVRDGKKPAGPQRYRSVVNRSGGGSRFDLSAGIPDSDLLPDMRPALARVSRRNLTTSYLDEPILPALHDLLVSRWPFHPELLTIVDGAMDAIDRVSAMVVSLGDFVVVEEPGFPPLFDLIESLGATPIGVPGDDHGMLPEALAVALAKHPVAIICQPRAQNPTGSSWTAQRAKQLADLIAPTPTIVIEDDHSGDIAWADPISLGTWLPEQTVHIRSFSKSHGPDLRLAAVGGAGAVVTQLIERRMLGPGWSSRLLQAVLLEMLKDPGTVESVSSARTEYHARRSSMVELLRERSIGTSGFDGINLWVDVANERNAQLLLSVAGISVSPGRPFWLRQPPAAHLRITVGNLSDDPVFVADTLARAAAAI
jgi:DNA-binding transcriptional MocR family regulator